MKKIVSILLLIIGIVIAGFGIDWARKDAVAVSIIGGADGPTSVFVAGKVSDGMIAGYIIVGAVLVILGILLYRKWHK